MDYVRLSLVAVVQANMCFQSLATYSSPTVTRPSSSLQQHVSGIATPSDGPPGYDASL